MSAPNIEGTVNAASLARCQMGTMDFSEFIVTPTANAAVIALSTTQTLNVLQTTSNGTISGAVINLPLNPLDGQKCKVVATGQITTVTGTISSSSVVLNPITELLIATGYNLTYSLALGLWVAGA